MQDIPPGVDLWQIPYQAPPLGVQSDFHKRSELLVPVIAIIAVFIFLQTLFLGLRIFTKFSRRDESWKIDDWCVLFTVVMCSTLGAAIIVGVQPAGRHTWDISIGTLTTAWIQRILILQHIFVGISLYLGKCCLLSMYYRVFGHIDRVRYQIYFTLVLGFPLIFSSIFQPIVSGPPPGTPWGTPNPNNNLATRSSLAVGIDNVLVDFIILYIPIPVIAQLNISRRRKFGVLMIFLTGLIAIVADIVILYFRVELFKQIDVLRYGIIVGTCCVVEIAISVVCSSMPVAAKFIRVYIGGSSLFHSLRSLFTSKGSEAGSSTSLGLPSFIKKPDPVRKKRDPYSLAMPSTNLSTTRLSQAQHTLDLGEVPDGYLRLEPIIYSADKQVTTKAGEIQRTVSVERTSSNYTDSEESKAKQEMSQV